MKSAFRHTLIHHEPFLVQSENVTFSEGRENLTPLLSLKVFIWRTEESHKIPL